ncbi:bifunctional molybdopterin-guanine dinucleotide biosynthesis adaptor protein MobB/molybdopterin molybdotransferase MoeA [Paraferrimonas sedimenticola]|uniref:Molybdopterin molybdenumtransferase n=1 Tax=Paraferrimonas sedimenticola TaxID=375674 RepID=A0AA37VZY9_9GAMM|nr:bifunctional molybdopterin-guanine dinucleotide biosynthesis adaptor protein MobB/molybdopterin molybdotransferase MoeA [Paraferrimonas sedimenticola]GLP97539.1 bifunctional molybdopterin-guanine dinucleotide biosynthesis protein MobB/molybdopterin molybdotransferase MoeA [Paraferrimonas sedimenticola]
MATPFQNPLNIPVIGFCAYSGTGKTTLLKKLIPELNRRGLRLACVKHAHHNFDVDTPGKDSYEMRHAGARQMLVASHIRWALMTEDKVDEAPSLPHLLRQIEQDQVDIVLVEGFKKLALPKIELHRASHGKPLIHEVDEYVQAIACDDETELQVDIERLDLNNVEQIADYVCAYAKREQRAIAARRNPIEAECGCDTDPSKPMSVGQGVAHITAQVTPITETETCPIHQALNRVLADDAVSPINVPQNTNSAMDGYAFAHSDEGQGPYQVVGEVLAGHVYSDTLQSGQAVKIMTGAAMPAGADTVELRELASEADGQVRFSKPTKAGQHVRQAGEDIAQGQVALAKHTRVGAAEQGLLASLGFGEINAVRRPKVAVFSTGDEVCQPGEPLTGAGIYDSNRYTIMAMLAKLDCEVIDLGIIEDSQQSLADALTQASTNADVIISSGGVSVGDADFVKLALKQVGQINFWKIAMRPGRPLAFGQVGDALFFGLPGNPVAVMVSFLQFVQPALRKLAGEVNYEPVLVPAIAAQDFRSRLGRTEFSRGLVQMNQQGQWQVSSTGSQGSGILSSMVRGNCLVVIPESVAQVAKGDTVLVQPFADLL